MVLRGLCASFESFWSKQFSSTIVCRVGKLPLRSGQIGNMICSLKKKAGFIAVWDLDPELARHELEPKLLLS